MCIRLLTTLFLTLCLLNANSPAEDALRSVQIVEGITQQRPLNTRQTIGRRYVWNFQGKSYTVLMTIDLERYNSYAAKERSDIPELVEESSTTIGNLTREFLRTFKQRRDWSKQTRVDFVLSFVQSLPYTLDDVTTGYDEFRRYAIETLIEGGGDCEDTTILVAAILRGLGESTALIFTPGHIALGVSGDFTGTSLTYNGTKYYYCETTGTGWTVGVLPTTVDRTVEAVVPLTPAKLGSIPEPKSVKTPDLVRSPPNPKRIDPTPELTPPIKPNPEKPSPSTPPIKPDPEEPAPEGEDPSDTNSAAGKLFAVLLILIGLGILIVYVVYRFVLSDSDDDWPDEVSEYDDEDSSPGSTLYL